MAKPSIIEFPTRTQYSFSRLWNGYDSNEEAEKARNSLYKELKKLGKQVRRCVLKNQLKKYDGLGQTNGGICNVYLLFVEN